MTTKEVVSEIWGKWMKEGIFNIAELPHDVSLEIENGKIDINMQVWIAIDHGTWYERHSYSAEDRDEMVAQLFDLSLTHTIESWTNSSDPFEIDGNKFNYTLWLRELGKHELDNTNITADIIDCLYGLLKYTEQIQYLNEND